MNNFSIAPWKTAHSYGRTYIRTIRDAQGEHIAHVCDLHDATPEAIANARLMAAAPDLLAALRALCEICEDDDQYPQNTEAARAAIARATGDQTVTA